MAYQAKTSPTKVKVATYLGAITDDARRADCKTLSALMKRVTGCSPKMWGPSIVGFDSYHYRYPSGHEGDSCVVGFSSGSAHITVYLMPGFEAAETKAALARLGKHRTGKSCLYLKRLADVELDVLEELVVRAVAAMRSLYPKGSS